MWSLEALAPIANDEAEFAAIVGQGFSNMGNEPGHLSPMQIARELATEQTLKEQLMVVTNVCSHSASIDLMRKNNWSCLLRRSVTGRLVDL
jgi:hypothetical protein